MTTDYEKRIASLNKSCKIGTLQFGVKFEQRERIPFSSARLNYSTYGGIPVGMITEFSGSEGSGKTTTALDLICNAQKKYPDKVVLFVDIECTFDSDWATKLGVDLDKLIYYRDAGSGAEELFQQLYDWLDDKSKDYVGDVSLCVLDSIGAMVSNQENDKDIGDRTYGGISMALTRFSKKLVPLLSRTKCTFLAINQMRDDMNSMYGGSTTTGGKAFRHNCAERITFRKGQYVDEKGNTVSRACENPVGNLVQYDILKSKVHKADRKVGFYTLNYMTGIDYISDTVDLAIKKDIVHQAGAWYSIIDTDTGEILTDNEGTLLKFQGKTKLLEYLKVNEDEYNNIVNRLEM